MKRGRSEKKALARGAAAGKSSSIPEMVIFYITARARKCDEHGERWRLTDLWRHLRAHRENRVCRTGAARLSEAASIASGAAVEKSFDFM